MVALSLQQNKLQLLYNNRLKEVGIALIHLREATVRMNGVNLIDDFPQSQSVATQTHITTLKVLYKSLG